LQKILTKDFLDKLTYFEYTTLLALYLSDEKDYIVLEAGLGGEFDATNVVKNDLTIVTAIGLDHQNFLGDTVSLIAATKMRSCDKRFILSNQVFEDVHTTKNEILGNKEEIIKKTFLLSPEGKNLPIYLQNNLEVVLSVLDYLGFSGFSYKLPKLFGRYQKLNDTITIDVGHNPLAAEAIAKELEKENKKFILIYNSFKDKDYLKVLRTLSPYISEVQIIDCNDTRIVNKSILEETIRSLTLDVSDFDIMNMQKKNYYFVFGSFVVIETFLKRYAVYEKR
jgi:dihydrofolate synthase/folylpolyglutamate synthase